MTSQEAWDQAQVVVQSLKSGERKTLMTGGSDQSPNSVASQLQIVLNWFEELKQRVPVK